MIDLDLDISRSSFSPSKIPIENQLISPGISNRLGGFVFHQTAATAWQMHRRLHRNLYRGGNRAAGAGGKQQKFGDDIDVLMVISCGFN